MKHIAIRALALIITLPFAAVAQQQSTTPEDIYTDTDFSSADEIAERLNKGIVLDVTPFEKGSANKIAYTSRQLDAIVDAGFKSIRIYTVSKNPPQTYKGVIDDALERGLIVVISFWGRGEWAKNPEAGIDQFVEDWRAYATHYKNYPEELVFDVWNEPSGLLVINGKPVGIKDEAMVMRYQNAAIPVIRESNPNRILGIGGPGLNHPEVMVEYINTNHLGYTLKDGSGFAEDQRIIGMFHMYRPPVFCKWTRSLSSYEDWKQIIKTSLDVPQEWARKWDKPVVLSEWGAWAPPVHPVEEWREYLQFVVDELARRDIAWIYFCAGFNNQYGYNILNTQEGWNQDALDILTGVTAPPIPKLNALMNSELGWSSQNWNTKGSVSSLRCVQNEGLSGKWSLEVQATAGDAEVYQQTRKYRGAPPRRYAISVKNGKRYEVSFLAKCKSGGTGKVKVAFSEIVIKENGPGFQDDEWIVQEPFWKSESIDIASGVQKHTVVCDYTGDDVRNVRISFLFGDKTQTIVLDSINLLGLA